MKKAQPSYGSATGAFLQKLAKVHCTDEYGFDKVDYRGQSVLVTVFCYACQKEFQITPKVLLRGSGCQDCGIKKRAASKVVTAAKTFMANLKKRDPDGRFLYHKTQYVDFKTSIIITCSVCGCDIERRSCNYLRRNCPQCNLMKMRSTTSEFIQKARVVHNNRYSN